MAAPFNRLTQRCEAALIAAVTGSLTGYAELTGTDDASKTAPNITAVAENTGEEEPIGSGNYRVNCRVTVNSQANDTSQSDHQNNVGTVFDLLRQDDIDSTLSTGTSDFHCIAVRQLGEETENTETEFSTSILLDLYCASTDL